MKNTWIMKMADSVIFNLPQWYDLHTHLRQDDLLSITIAAQHQGQCAGVLAMPNTKPPVAKVFASDPLPYWSIETYQTMIRKNGGEIFQAIIVPLYLTEATTTEMLMAGAKSGLLRACKYYPPHGTTHASHACDFDTLAKRGIFSTMEEYGIILCVHGESHHLSSTHYFDRHTNAETHFYENYLDKLHQQHPHLKIVCEHITTETAVSFVNAANTNVAATVTPQHLLYTVGDLLKGFNFHLYCLPLLKFESDRAALQRAVTSPSNTQFFAGTDSAPHTHKTTACGCAAGCFTASIAPALYAEAFELAGIDLTHQPGQTCLQRFLCDNGARFYQLPSAKKTFQLRRAPQKISPIETSYGQLIPLPIGLGRDTLNWQID